MTKSSKDSDGELLANLPLPSPETREALWRARAPRPVAPAELASWLAALCQDDGEALRKRPPSVGEAFELR